MRSRLTMFQMVLALLASSLLGTGDAFAEDPGVEDFGPELDSFEELLATPIEIATRTSRTAPSSLTVYRRHGHRNAGAISQFRPGCLRQ